MAHGQALILKKCLDLDMSSRFFCSRWFENVKNFWKEGGLTIYPIMETLYQVPIDSELFAESLLLGRSNDSLMCFNKQTPNIWQNFGSCGRETQNSFVNLITFWAKNVFSCKRKINESFLRFTQRLRSITENHLNSYEQTFIFQDK